MKNFYYQIPTEIYFGKGQIKHLGEAIRKYGEKILFVYGGGSIKRSGLYQTIKSILEQNGIEAVELSGIDPNPRIESVRRGVELFHNNKLDLILAAGGGSAIDCAKLISAGVKYNGDSWDMVLDSALITDTAPLITIPTLAATGSEMDRIAVISNPDTCDKTRTFSPLFYPKVSILDPEYTFSVPKNQTAAGTADIMSHVIEHYFNNIKGAYIQNRLADGLLKTCIKYGPIAYNEPDNYEARANLMWAASLAIDGITWRGNDVAISVHPMEHQLSAYYDITHGVGLAVLIPNWMRYVLNEKTVDRFVEYGINVWDIDKSIDKFEIANKAIDKTREFFVSMNIPGTLREIGIGEEHFEVMARKAAGGLENAFYPLTWQDVMKIYEMSL